MFVEELDGGDFEGGDVRLDVGYGGEEGFGGQGEELAMTADDRGCGLWESVSGRDEKKGGDVRGRGGTSSHIS
jgi:hypothetical protein